MRRLCADQTRERISADLPNEYLVGNNNEKEPMPWRNRFAMASALFF